MKLKKEIPLTIPNKKINRSPQYKNYLPGKNICFKPINQRVTQINSLVVGVIKCKTPAYVLADNVLTVSCETEGASIYYTTDGSMPTVASTLYEEPISIEGDTDFRFVAVKNGMISSDELEVSAELALSSPVISLDYKTGEVLFDNPNSIGDVYYKTEGMADFAQYTESVYISTAQTVSAKVVYGAYSSEIASRQYQQANVAVDHSGVNWVTGNYSVLYKSETEGAEFRITSDGSTPLYNSSEGNVMSTPVYGNPITSKCRVFAEGNVPSQTLTVNIGYDKPDAPSIVVDNGNVVISKAGTTVNVRTYKIYYTNDGSTPTSESELYSEPFAAVSGQTIKAIIICYDTYSSDPSELVIE